MLKSEPPGVNALLSFTFQTFFASSVKLPFALSAITPVPLVWKKIGKGLIHVALEEPERILRPAMMALVRGRSSESAAFNTTSTVEAIVRILSNCS